MKRKSLPALWMGTAFGVALVLAATVLALKGIDPKSLRIALRLRARWSFVLFWVAYTGGAMGALFGPALAPLARRGREFGLPYARSSADSSWPCGVALSDYVPAAAVRPVVGFLLHRDFLDLSASRLVF